MLFFVCVSGGESYQLKTVINPKGPTVTNNAVRCIMSIADHHFVRRPGLIIIPGSFNMTPPGADIQKIFLQEVHHLRRWSLMTVEKVDRSMEVAFADKAHYYVLIVDSFDRFFRKINLLTLLRSWNPRAYVIVLCSQVFTTQSSLRTFAEKVLTHLWSYYVLHGVILLQDAEEKTKFQVFIWNPFDPPRRCGNSSDDTDNTVEFYGLCADGHLAYTKQLFRKKLPTDMKGCALNVWSTVMPPFVYPIDDNSTGIEHVLLNTIGEFFNFEFIHNITTMLRGEKDQQNQTWDGLMGKLINREADIVVGGIYPDNEVHDDFDSSISYLQDSYTWVVPRAKEMPKWRALTIIFDPHMWLATFIIYFLCMGMWYILGNLSMESQYQTTLVHCALNILYMNIGGSAYSRPRFQTLRVLFVFFNLYSVILITAYQTKLITVLTESSYETQLDSVEELLESGLQFGGFGELKGFFEDNNSSLDHMIDERYISVENLDEALHKVTIDEDFSMLSSRLYLKYVSATKSEYNNQNGEPAYHSFTKNVFSIPLEITTFKGFPFIGRMNKKIGLLKASGLFSKWLEDASTDFKRQTAEAQRQSSIAKTAVVDNEDVRLSLQHLQGGFLILRVGLGTGSAVFGVEFFLNTCVFFTIRDGIKHIFSTLQKKVQTLAKKLKLLKY